MPGAGRSAVWCEVLETLRVLVIGYGNPGRRDDGLGPRLAETVAGWEVPGVDAAWDYQLNVEHAADVARAGVVLFIDAAREADEPFGLYRTGPSGATHFSTHSMPPEAVLDTCREVYGAVPPAFILALKGDDFEMGEDLTPAAETRLARAEEFLRAVLSSADPLAALESQVGRKN